MNRIMIMTFNKPSVEGETVYSNMDHEYTLSEKEVKASKSYHQHAAWNFCGYVWYDNTRNVFVEEVWQYNNLTITLVAKSLADVIKQAIDDYGDD